SGDGTLALDDLHAVLPGLGASRPRWAPSPPGPHRPRCLVAPGGDRRAGLTVGSPDRFRAAFGVRMRRRWAWMSVETGERPGTREPPGPMVRRRRRSSSHPAPTTRFYAMIQTSSGWP